MPIDRPAQLKLLHDLATHYPDNVDIQNPEVVGMNTATIRFHLSYLEEHGLVDCRWAGMDRTPILAKITAPGLDFIEKDGGLSAILGVVTIRLHDDTIKELIAQRILGSDLPQPDKRRYLDALRELPGESTKHLVLKLVDKGLETGPQAMEWLEKLLLGHL